MEYHTIQIDEYFTSYKFYHSLLPQLSLYARSKIKRNILFDFTNTKRVSSLVIPNLLCVGYIINTNYNFSPTIFVPDNSNSDNIRDFLHDIGFVQLARNYGLFTFTPSIDYGKSHRILDPLCQTHEFNPNLDNEDDESVIRTEVSRHFRDFFRTLLPDFNCALQSAVGAEKYLFLGNIAEDICAQLIYNSITHGNSFAFMSAEVNHAAEKIYISIADCGIGFKKCINTQIEHGQEPFERRRKMMSDELEAIVNAIFVRAEEEHNQIYGIYPLINRVLGLNGTVRIHSVDTQLILTKSMQIKLAVAADNRSNIAQIRQTFLKLMRDKKANTYNVYTNMKCGGVHIEIELPLRREVL